MASKFKRSLELLAAKYGGIVTQKNRGGHYRLSFGDRFVIASCSPSSEDISLKNVERDVRRLFATMKEA